MPAAGSVLAVFRTLGQHPGSSRAAEGSRDLTTEREGSPRRSCAPFPLYLRMFAISPSIAVFERVKTNAPLAMVRMGSPVRFRRGAPYGL
jgi:hypothetical protein